jgi:hypothetical protein
MKKVVFIALLVPATVVADKSFTGDKKITWDCAKDPELSITTGKADITITGACKSIAITGGDNKLVIESVDDLVLNGNNIVTKVGTLAEIVVNGNKNVTTAETLGEITFNGNNNVTTYVKAKSGKAPSVQDNGKSNSIGKPKPPTKK